MRRGPGLGVLHFTACNSDTNFISTQNIVIQHHWPLLAKLWTSRSWSAVIRSLAWYFLHTNWPNWAGCCWKRHSSTQEICVGVWSWSRRRASSCSVCCHILTKFIFSDVCVTKIEEWPHTGHWIYFVDPHNCWNAHILTTWPECSVLVRGGGWTNYSPHLANYWTETSCPGWRRLTPPNTWTLSTLNLLWQSSNIRQLDLHSLL